MLFVDAYKFKNKSNKSAILAKLKFYEFPIIIGMRNSHCKCCAKFTFFISLLKLPNILLII